MKPLEVKFLWDFSVCASVLVRTHFAGSLGGFLVVLLRSTGSAFIHASLPVLGDRRELGLGVCWAEPRLPQRRFLAPSSRSSPKISRYATLLPKSSALMPAMAQISPTVRTLKQGSGGVAAQPGVEIFRPLEVE